MATTYLQKLRLFNRNVRLFIAWGVFFGFGLWGIFMVLHNLYLLRLGFGPGTVGLVSAVGTGTWAICSLPGGALARRWGVRRTMIAGLGLHAASVLLLPLGVFKSQELQLGWILAMWVLYGVGSGAFVASYPPFLTMSTGEAERAHAFSVWAGFSSVAGFVGGLVSGNLPGLFSRLLGLPLDHPATFRYPLIIAGVILVAGVLLILATREVAGDTAEATAGVVGPAPVGLIVLLAATYMLSAVGEAVILPFFNVYLDGGLQVATPLIGALWAAGRMASGGGSLAAPIVMARWGKRRTIVLGALGIALGLLPLALIPNWAAAGLGYMALSAMSAITLATFSVLSQESVAPGWRSTVAGAIGLTWGMSYVVMGLGGGYAVMALGYRPLFGLTAVLPAAAALLLWAYFRAPRGELAQPSGGDDREI